jgi:hypothetical protein
VEENRRFIFAITKQYNKQPGKSLKLTLSSNQQLK